MFKRATTSIIMCLINFICLPVAFLFTLIALVLMAISSMTSLNPAVFDLCVTIIVFIIISFIYGICASCCGKKIMKFILAVLFAAIGIFMFIESCYILSYVGKFATLLKELIATASQEVADAIREFVNYVGCEDIDDAHCEELINKYANKVFLMGGIPSLLISFIIIGGSVLGFWYAFYKKQGFEGNDVETQQSPTTATTAEASAMATPSAPAAYPQAPPPPPPGYPNAYPQAPPPQGYPNAYPQAPPPGYPQAPPPAGYPQAPPPPGYPQAPPPEYPQAPPPPPVF